MVGAKILRQTGKKEVPGKKGLGKPEAASNKKKKKKPSGVQLNNSAGAGVHQKKKKKALKSSNTRSPQRREMRYAKILIRRYEVFQ